jgi:hypothetical protein
MESAGPRDPSTEGQERVGGEGRPGGRTDPIDLNRFVGADAMRVVDTLRNEGVQVTTVRESLPPTVGVLAALAPAPTVESRDHVVVHTWGNEVVRMTIDVAARQRERAAELDERVTSLESLADRVGDLEERAINPDRLNSVEARVAQLEARVAQLEGANAARQDEGGQGGGRTPSGRGGSSGRSKGRGTPKGEEA